MNSSHLNDAIKIEHCTEKLDLAILKEKLKNNNPESPINGISP